MYHMDQLASKYKRCLGLARAKHKKLVQSNKTPLRVGLKLVNRCSTFSQVFTSAQTNDFLSVNKPYKSERKLGKTS